MGSAPYTDPTTGQWVGEHETRDAEGEVRRQTEWFATEAEARHFSRTGRKRPVRYSSETVTRETQQTDRIYVIRDSGTAFVTPDGEGRFYYDRETPREYEWDIALPDGLDDEQAAIWVAQQQHGDDLPLHYLDTAPED